jgi:tripartite ATP-independent transporter DctM subunit
MAGLYTGYILIRSYLQPSLAPPYKVAPPPLPKRLISFARYVLPLSVIVFLVTGVIFLGVATPSEAAATGALGSFILAAIYGGLNWKKLKEIVTATIAGSGMIFMIFSGAIVYSQILAYTGASRGLAELVAGLPLPTIALIIFMQLVLLIMGMFMEPMTIIMVALPVYMPIIKAVGIDPIWFGVLMLLNAEMAITSPPFGLGLFAMKGVAPPDTTMGDIYRAALPFIGCDLIAMALIMAFPVLALGLPGMMR